jgi:hypothetical protein
MNLDEIVNTTVVGASMIILGPNAFHGDASAAIVRTRPIRTFRLSHYEYEIPADQRTIDLAVT